MVVLVTVSVAVPSPFLLHTLASAPSTTGSSLAVAAAGFLSPPHAAPAPAAAPATAATSKEAGSSSSGNSSSKAGDHFQAHLQQLLSQLAVKLTQEHQSVVETYAVQEEEAAKQQQNLKQLLQEERAGKAAAADKLFRTNEELCKWRARALEAEGALAAAKQSRADEQATARATAAAKLADVEGQLAMLQEQYDTKEQELQNERNPATGAAYRRLREWQGAYDTLYECHQELKQKLEAAQQQQQKQQQQQQQQQWQQQQQQQQWQQQQQQQQQPQQQQQQQQQQGPRQGPPTPTHHQQQAGHFLAGMAPGVGGAWSQGSQSPVDLQQQQQQQPQQQPQVGAGAGGHVTGPPRGFRPGAAAARGWGPRGMGAGVGALLPDQMGGGPMVWAGLEVGVRGVDASGENARAAGGFGQQQQQQQQGGDMKMLTDNELVQLVLELLPGNVAEVGGGGNVAVVGMAELEGRINQKLGQGVWQQVYARRYGDLGAFLARMPELFGILDEGRVYQRVGIPTPQGGYGWGDASAAGRGPWGSSNYQQQREQESYQRQQEVSYGQPKEQTPQPLQGRQQQQHYEPGRWGMALTPPQQQDSSTSPAAGRNSGWGGPNKPTQLSAISQLVGTSHQLIPPNPTTPHPIPQCRSVQGCTRQEGQSEGGVKEGQQQQEEEGKQRMQQQQEDEKAQRKHEQESMQWREEGLKQDQQEWQHHHQQEERHEPWEKDQGDREPETEGKQGKGGSTQQEQSKIQSPLLQQQQLQQQEAEPKRHQKDQGGEKQGEGHGINKQEQQAGRKEQQEGDGEQQQRRDGQYAPQGLQGGQQQLLGRARVPHVCFNPSCGKSGPELALRKCSRCSAVRYCSRECQTEHWKEHKASCR